MLWNFKKTHAKAWQLRKDQWLEVQFDYFSETPLFSMDLDRRTTGQDHPGVRVSWGIFHWVLSVDYYSIHHADQEESEE